MSHLWPLILSGCCCCPCFYTDHRCTWMWKSQNRTNPFKYRSFHRLACVGFKERGKKEQKALEARHSVCNKQKLFQRQRTRVQYKAPGNQRRVQVIWWKRLLCFWQYVPKSGASQNKNHKKTNFFVEVHTFIEFCWHVETVYTTESVISYKKKENGPICSCSAK